MKKVDAMIKTPLGLCLDALVASIGVLAAILAGVIIGTILGSLIFTSLFHGIPWVARLDLDSLILLQRWAI